MATFTKLNGFVEHLAEGTHNLGTGVLTIALSNTAPASEVTPPTGSTAACILANVTQISYANCSARVPTIASSSQAAGTYTLVLTDLVLTATGTVGPFRYVYLYNDTATSPVDALIGYWDRGSSVTLENGDNITLDFAATTISLS